MSKKKVTKIDSYVAHAKSKAGVALTTAYKIEVRFLGGLTPKQKNAFKAAADRWTNIIVGDLPSVMVDGEVIDDLLILAQGVPIDGVGGILGQAGPTHLRPAAAGASAFLPVKGMMSFDSADLKRMEQDGTLGDVIAHEMGHVIGIGTVWTHKGLLKNGGAENPTFEGVTARREFGRLKGTGSKPVPVENTGGPGTRDGHWRETVFQNELMSGFIAAPNNPLSRMTAASLKDMGYEVNMDAAEPFTLPNLLQLAEEGVLMAHVAEARPHALPIIPMTMPDDSLR